MTLGEGPRVLVRRLSPADRPEVERVYRECPRFFELVAGVPEVPADYVREDMEGAPPGLDPERKVFAGIVLRESGRMIGVLDLLLGYPRPGAGFLGLLLVADALRSRGYGAEALGVAEAWARRQGIEEVSLGVELVNEGARRFWAREGYAPTGERFEHEVLGRTNAAEVLRKPLVAEVGGAGRCGSTSS